MKQIHWILFSALILLLLGAGLQFYVHELRPTEFPVFGTVTNFSLTDSDTKKFSRDDLRGKIWVVNFFFTSCEGICPAINGEIAALYRRVYGEREIKFLSISIDPEKDTPEKLAEYAKRFNADTTQWHFLTGDKLEIEKLLRDGFKLGSGETPTAHTTFVTLLDRQGKIRGYYRGLEEDSMRKLAKDLRKLKKMPA